MIKHILADGTELKSIEGIVVPAAGKTEAVYRLVADYIANDHLRGIPASRPEHAEKSA